MEKEIEVTTLEMGPPTEEERELTKTLEHLYTIKNKYYKNNIPDTIKNIQTASRLQTISKSLRSETLKELRKMKIVKDIVEFDWS